MTPGANDSYSHLRTNAVYKSTEYNYKSIHPKLDANVLHGGDTNNQPFGWMCPSLWPSCDNRNLPKIHSQAQNGSWYVNDLQSSFEKPLKPQFKVEYCLAMEMESHCKVRYSAVFMILAIVSNSIKTGILLYIWLWSSDVPLLTIGDAIASFLCRPDPHTHGACLLTAHTVKSIDLDLPLKHPPAETLYKLGPMEFTETRRNWASGASKRRWALCIFL